MDPEESECERLLQEGDPEAIPRLLKRYNRPLLSFLCHQVGDRTAAEDLMQEVLVRVWRNREGYEAQGRLSGWLFTIARRLAIDHLEKESRRPKPLGAQRDEDGAQAPSPQDRLLDPSTPERELESAGTRSRIEAAIAALPEEQRETFLLREYGGVSFAEIAQMTGSPLGTALARMRYAVLKLRKTLGESDAI